MKTISRLKIKRRTGYRDLFIISQFVTLIKNGKITTTKIKAKALKSFADSLLDDVRNADNLKVRRNIERKLKHNAVLDWFLKNYKNIEDRNGGYTSLIGIGYRHGDSSDLYELSIIGWDKLMKKSSKKKVSKIKKEESKE